MSTFYFEHHFDTDVVFLFKIGVREPIACFDERESLQLRRSLDEAIDKLIVDKEAGVS